MTGHDSVKLDEYHPSAWTGKRMAGHFSHITVFENGSTLYSPIDPRQIQPNGVDLTADKLFEQKKGPTFTREKKFIDPGYLLEQRPDDLAGLPDGSKGWFLERSWYLVEWREVIVIPKNAIGLIFPRSTLLRLGGTICTAVWDRGYQGKGSSGIIVCMPMLLEWGTCLGQMIFIDAQKDEQLYDGQYQFENLPDQETQKKKTYGELNYDG